MDDERLSLPTIAQIVMAGERPVLAALDVLLELSVRTLMAQHPDLEAAGRTRPQDQARALACTAVTLARSLREVVAGYLLARDRALESRDRWEDEIPF